MSDSTLLFFSNQTETLYEKLRSQLFSTHRSPFLKRLLIVEGPAMQSWLMKRLAQDLGIATGIEIVFKSKAFPYLLELTQYHHPHYPTSSDLAFAIEVELRDLIKRFPDLTNAEKQKWHSLVTYLIDNSNERIIGLSHQLGEILYSFGYSTSSIPESDGWMVALWEVLYRNNPGWSWPGHQFLQPIKKNENLAVYFFAITDLNPLECDYLYRLGQYCSVNHYFLSPCMMFWADTRSDRERVSLLNFWQQKKINDDQLVSLEKFLEDQNPLLANWGKMGRIFVEYWEDKLAQISCHYHLFSSNQIHLDASHFESLSIEPTETLTLLHAIQSDLLTLRNPESSPVIHLPREDDSLQIHISANKRREVEALYQVILDNLHKDHTLTPADFLVVSPVLNEYQFFIETCFRDSDRLLSPHFYTDHSFEFQMIHQALLDLLELVDSRWETSHLLRLLTNPYFQRSHQFTQNDIKLIIQKIKSTQISWGFDESHRQHQFWKGHATLMSKEPSFGTWSAGLTRIKEGSEPEHLELIIRFDQVLKALYSELSGLIEKKQTIQEWSKVIHKLVLSHLSPNQNNPSSIESFEYILNEISRFGNHHRHFKNSIFSFESINFHLKKKINQSRRNYSDRQSNSILFGSFVELASIPAKIVVLLGMSEDAFPNTNIDSPGLSLPSLPFTLSNGDKDRYRFLETLISSRKKLLIFYSKNNGKDNEETNVSPVVNELLSYCDRFYSIDGLLPSIHCTVHHPFQSFSEKHFESSSPCPNYSYLDYQRALLAHLQTSTSPNPNLLFSAPTSLMHNPSFFDLSLFELRQAAKNPIKLYLNKTLSVYLKKPGEWDLIKADKLTLSSLEKYQIREKMLSKTLDQILAGKEFQSTSGLFRELAQRQSTEEAESLQTKLSKIGLQADDLFEIEFSAYCSSPSQIDHQLWQFPSPCLKTQQGHSINLKGKISNLTRHGLILQEKNSVSNAWKNWPMLLLCAYACHLKPNLFENQVIYTQSSKPLLISINDPFTLLTNWCEYYLQCIEQLSPLLPDWIPFILEGNTEGLKKEQEKVFSDFTSPFANQELRWILASNDLPSPDFIINKWGPLARQLFGVKH